MAVQPFATTRALGTGRPNIVLSGPLCELEQSDTRGAFALLYFAFRLAKGGVRFAGAI